MERKTIVDLKDYAFEIMNNTNSATEHFFWKGQYLAYSNVLDIIDEKIEETRDMAQEDEWVKMAQEDEWVKKRVRAKKLLDAIFRADEIGLDDKYEFNNE